MLTAESSGTLILDLPKIFLLVFLDGFGGKFRTLTELTLGALIAESLAKFCLRAVWLRSLRKVVLIFELVFASIIKITVIIKLTMILFQVLNMPGNS